MLISILLLFVVLIVAFYFLAKLIVNYVPIKFHKFISLLLILISLFLGYKIYDSVIGDIKFNTEKVIRYQKVVDGLKLIRDAEVAYKTVKGEYTSDYNKLIQFIETEKFPITSVREESRKVMERGILVDKEYKVVDTLGYRAVLEDFSGRDYKNMMTVPGSDLKYELRTGFVEKGKNKVKTPVFEARIAKKDVLAGLPNDQIEKELGIIGIDEINGEYVTVGALDDVKETGNWPPVYDSRKTSDTK